jgi:predicted nucleic acid-binding protein
MIFLDTSAIYALADAGDPNHDPARARFRAALQTGERFLTHNYVLLESIALVQHRLGLPAALRVAREGRRFDVEWVDEAMHDEAVAGLAGARPRRVSLVDQMSFLVMRRRGVAAALAFDDDFPQEGFRIYEG